MKGTTTMEKDYSYQNAKAVLAQLNFLIKGGHAVPMSIVCDRLSIFDWWIDTLSVARMKQMRTFLETAIAEGYVGYVCFKVGVAGCANGMWAHKAESKDGYSPDGDFLYRSFTTDTTYWCAYVDGKYYPDCKGERYDHCKRFGQLKGYLPSSK